MVQAELRSTRLILDLGRSGSRPGWLGARPGWDAGHGGRWEKPMGRGKLTGRWVKIFLKNGFGSKPNVALVNIKIAWIYGCENPTNIHNTRFWHTPKFYGNHGEEPWEIQSRFDFLLETHDENMEDENGSLIPWETHDWSKTQLGWNWGW